MTAQDDDIADAVWKADFCVEGSWNQSFKPVGVSSMGTKRQSECKPMKVSGIRIKI